MENHIYILSHPKTNEIVYVGKSKNPRVRYRDHCRFAQYTRCLLDAWKNQLISQGLKPIMTIIISCDESLVDESEKYFIQIYRGAGIDLLNMTEGGDGLQNPSEEVRRKIGEKSKGRIFSDATREKLQQVNYNRPNPIICFNKNGEFIGDFINSRRASEILQIDYKSISASVRGKTHFVYGYTFFKKNEKDIENKLKLRMHNAIDKGRIFLSIDNYGNINEHDSLIRAAETSNCSFKNIWLCLNGKRKKSGNLAWIYKDNYNGDFHTFFTKKTTAIPIIRTIGGESQEFRSAVEASEKLGIHKSSICYYLKGKKNPPDGSTWRYKVV